ncbi:hypothetical protein BH23CHL2_BH23CHL2_13950 [soil metagenome]
MTQRSRMSDRYTRREFLGTGIRLSAGAAAVALAANRGEHHVHAQPRTSRRVEVLVADLVESTAADFTRGQRRGVTIVGGSGRSAMRGSLGAEFVSGALSAPFSATHIGLHWVLGSGSPDDLIADVRTLADVGQWSDWREVTIEAVSEESGGTEVFAALTAGGRTRELQYRLRFASDDPVLVNQVTATTINSVDGQEFSTTAEPAAVSLPVADGTSLSVITRAGWGCDEKSRFRGRNERWPEMYVPAKKVVLHHTATSNGYTDAAAEVRAIYTYHARTLGWGDIGYNLLVGKDGEVFEGRHGRGEDDSREIASADVVAGHVFGHNYGSSGIAALGNSSDDDWHSNWGGAGLRSIEDAVTFECGRHYIAPLGSSDFLKSDDIWHFDLDNCSGHSDSFNTECPGTVLYAYLGNTLRDAVEGRLQGAAPPALSGVQDGNSLSFKWDGTANEFWFCLEGWFKPSNSEDIDCLSGSVDQSAQFNDPLAMAQHWQRTTATSMNFSSLAAGYYTMHLRDAIDEHVYETNLTYLVEEGDDGGGDDDPPTTTIVSPLDGSTVGGSVVIQVDASDAEDPDGSLTVQIRIDGGEWQTASFNSTNGNYETNWDTTSLEDGSSHTIEAQATDSAGNQGAVDSVTVTIDNSSSGPARDLMHVGDLDGSATSSGPNWSATVAVTVHDADHLPVSDATVHGTWSGGHTASVSATTDGNGQCSFSTPDIHKRNGSVTFSVDTVSHDSLSYDATANHDPDGDSDGTSIAVSKSV